MCFFSLLNHNQLKPPKEARFTKRLTNFEQNINFQIWYQKCQKRPKTGTFCPDIDFIFEFSIIKLVIVPNFIQTEAFFNFWIKKA